MCSKISEIECFTWEFAALEQDSHKGSIMAQAQLPYQLQKQREREKHPTLPSVQENRETHIKEQPDWSDHQCQKSLKLVLKWEIQNLIQRLADAGEEALIVTANISEDSSHILGSQFGEMFVLQSDLALLKQQFLKYCRVHCKKKRSADSMTSNRKPSTERGSCKRQKKVLHHIVRKDDSSNNDCVSPLRGDLNDQKGNEEKNDFEQISVGSSIPHLTSSESKGHSRRKHTPKRVIPSLPASQSESDSEDNELDLDTIVKVEVNEDLENDLYGEGKGHLDDFKSDYFDAYKTEGNELLDTFKADNLSDDSNGGACNGFLKENHELQNNIGHGKDPVLPQFQRARKSTKSGKGSIGICDKSGNLSDDSSVGPFSNLLDTNGYQNSYYLGKDLVPQHTQQGRQSTMKNCDSYKNGSLSTYTNMESDSDLSGIDGLPTDAVSLPDTDKTYQTSVPLLVHPKMTVDPQPSEQAMSLDLSKKSSSKSASHVNVKSSITEDESAAFLLSQGKRRVRQHECPVCSLMVRDRHDLKRHLLTHTKEKPYSCDLCGKKFTRKWDQKNHVKKHEETAMRESYVEKTSELQVKQNIDSIIKLTRKVEMQKHVMEKKGFVKSIVQYTY